MTSAQPGGAAHHPEPLTDPELTARFGTRGYVGPYPMLEAGLLAAARVTVDALIAEVPADRMTTTFALHNRHLDAEPLWAVATHPRLLDIGERLSGPDLVLIGTRVVCKLGGEPSAVPWHQDIPFMGLAPARTVTAWVAIDDADGENGALALVPGPAHRPPRPHHKIAGDRRLGLLTDVEALDVAAGEVEMAVRPAVPAGHVLYFGGGVLHGGDSNSSPRRRCAITVRFVTGSTQLLNAEQWSALRVRGDGADPSGGSERVAAAAFEASRRA